MKKLIFLLLVFSFACSIKLVEEKPYITETYYGKVTKVEPVTRAIFKWNRSARVYADSGILFLYGDYTFIRVGNSVVVMEEPMLNFIDASVFAHINGRKYTVKERHTWQ